MAISTPRKQSIHHKRTRGQHHKRDHHYLKPYHPYLPLMLLVILALGINLVWTTRTTALNASASLSASELLVSTNAERQRNHETSLTIDPRLSAAAQAKVNDMVSQNYWAHNSPQGKTPWTFVKKSGYSYHIAGENLAYGFSDARGVVNGWMNSPEHRANLLNEGFEEVGFGIAAAENFQGKAKTTVVVAMYATPQSSAGLVGPAGDAGGIGTFASAQPTRTVSRIQLLGGSQAPWSLLIVVTLTMAGAAILIIRHARAWHRLLVQGEEFVLHHKVFDLAVLTIVLAGILLTRAGGFIS